MKILILLSILFSVHAFASEDPDQFTSNEDYYQDEWSAAKPFDVHEVAALFKKTPIWNAICRKVDLRPENSLAAFLPNDVDQLSGQFRFTVVDEGDYGHRLNVETRISSQDHPLSVLTLSDPRPAKCGPSRKSCKTLDIASVSSESPATQLLEPAWVAAHKLSPTADRKTPEIHVAKMASGNNLITKISAQVTGKRCPDHWWMDCSAGDHFTFNPTFVCVLAPAK